MRPKARRPPTAPAMAATGNSVVEDVPDSTFSDVAEVVADRSISQ